MIAHMGESLSVRTTPRSIAYTSDNSQKGNDMNIPKPQVDTFNNIIDDMIEKSITKTEQDRKTLAYYNKRQHILMPPLTVDKQMYLAALIDSCK
jgi:hypothetical protein